MLNSAGRIMMSVLGLAALYALITPNHSSAQLLASIDFPNSGAAEAQHDFRQGVLYLHNFEYEEANAAFRRAQEIDTALSKTASWSLSDTHLTLRSRTNGKDDGKLSLKTDSKVGQLLWMLCANL